MRILLTGFGPFPGTPENATSVLVPKLADAAGHALTDAVVTGVILPTEWRAGLEHARAAIDEIGPDVVLHFGVSDRAHGFVLETQARNCRDDMPDACGARPASDQVADTGPAVLPVGVPVARLAEALHIEGLPAQSSDDAGAYLCNAVLYQTLWRWPRLRAGFIHLPGDMGQPGPSLSLEAALRGGLVLLRVCSDGEGAHDHAINPTP